MSKDLENTPLECVIMIVSSIFILLTLFGIWYLLRKSGSVLAYSNVQVDEPTDMKSVTAVCSTATRITIYSTILDVKEILSKEDSE